MLTTEQDAATLNERRFVGYLAAGAALLAAIPAVAGYLSAPPGSTYLGFQFGSDDHLVYAAWMRQGMDFHFLMDNRFTTDPQPGLTIHLYFFVLGIISRFLGIGLTANLARVGFSALFVLLLYRLVVRLDSNNFGRKMSMVLAVFGGGLGFLVWHDFGVDFTKATQWEFLRGFLFGHLPTDVWQPEGFVFPSMLTNGLFMVSLCLILIAFLAMLSAQTTAKHWIIGAASMLLLMNIHSYDVLTVGLTCAGLVVMEISRRMLTWQWVGRALLVALGALPSALWFVYVLSHDSVFQARAATETYSPNFRAVLIGYLPLILLGYFALASRPARSTSERNRRWAGTIMSAVILIGLAIAAQNHNGGYFLNLGGWTVCFGLTLIALVLLADESPAWNLICSWALIGMIAIYFPGLFQRKLAMGLSIPWGILAGLGIARALRDQERNPRNLGATLAIILLSASSLRWLAREISLIRANVSNTTVEPVYLTPDAHRIVDFLDRNAYGKIVLAAPGVPSVPLNDRNEKIADTYLSPLMPDLNPVASGLAGAYSYAGHWSETPNYDRRRSELSKLFYDNSQSNQEKEAFLQRVHADYIIAPVPESFPALPVSDFRFAGTTLIDGNLFRLIRVRQSVSASP